MHLRCVDPPEKLTWDFLLKANLVVGSIFNQNSCLQHRLPILRFRTQKFLFLWVTALVFQPIMKYSWLKIKTTRIMLILVSELSLIALQQLFTAVPMLPLSTIIFLMLWIEHKLFYFFQKIDLIPTQLLWSIIWLTFLSILITDSWTMPVLYKKLFLSMKLESWMTLRTGSWGVEPLSKKEEFHPMLIPWVLSAEVYQENHTIKSKLGPVVIKSTM